MKIYIAGKITNNPNYKAQFAEAEKALKEQGHVTMNPSVLPDGFEHHEYMWICYRMIDVCDAVYLLNNWKDSAGALMEYDYALRNKKIIINKEALICGGA